jgi:hypothetical protein
MQFTSDIDETGQGTRSSQFAADPLMQSAQTAQQTFPQSALYIVGLPGMRQTLPCARFGCWTSVTVWPVRIPGKLANFWIATGFPRRRSVCMSITNVRHRKKSLTILPRVNASLL